jgi:hypothetical protein
MVNVYVHIGEKIVQYMGIKHMVITIANNNNNEFRIREKFKNTMCLCKIKPTWQTPSRKSKLKIDEPSNTYQIW